MGLRGSAALLVLAASVAVIAPGLPLSGSAGAARTTRSAWTVSPTDSLADGQLVTVTIKTTGDTPVSSAEIQLCKDGVTYQSAHQSQPGLDFATGGVNCPLQPISTSADRLIIVPGVNGTAPTPAGSITRFRVGLGTQDWTGSERRFEADDHLWAGQSLRPGRGGSQRHHRLLEPVRDEAHVPGQRPDRRVRRTSRGHPLGQRRLRSHAGRWIDWTLDHCHEAGQQGGASRAVFNGEGTAVNSFATGKIDPRLHRRLWQRGRGPHGGEPDVTPPGHRRARRHQRAVLAVAGGPTSAVNGDHVKVPYDDPQPHRG